MKSGVYMADHWKDIQQKQRLHYGIYTKDKVD